MGSFLLKDVLFRLSQDSCLMKRGYARYSLHHSPTDSLHFMLMAIKPFTSIIWHRSSQSGYNYYLVISGALSIREFTRGTFVSCAEHTINRNSLPALVDRSNWRCITNSESTITYYYEVCLGPHVPEETVWRRSSC